MKNRILAIFGIGTYILSVLSSASDPEGNSVAPVALIIVSAIATIIFIVMATIRLWKKSKMVSVMLISSASILFLSQLTQALASSSYGSPIIIFTNIIRLVYFIAFVWAIIILFKDKPNPSETKEV